MKLSDQILLDLRCFPESACVKIFIAERLCSKSEHNTAVRTDDCLGILIVTAEISEISAAANSVHKREQLRHHLAADAITLLIYRTAIGAGVGISDLLAVPAIVLGMLAAKISCDLNRELIFFVIPFFHTVTPKISHFLITIIPFYAVFVNNIIDFLTE